MADIQRRLPPECRIPVFKTFLCIIDCSKVFVERPHKYIARSQTFSIYKHHNTVHFLIGRCSSNRISYISGYWGGKIRDLELTKQSGFLDLVQEGDLIMADRGFHIAELLALRGASVIIPASTCGKPQPSQKDVEMSRRISRVRIQVERTINQLKRFRILQNTIPITPLKKGDMGRATVDKVLIICAAAVNMKRRIFGEKKAVTEAH